MVENNSINVIEINHEQKWSSVIAHLKLLEGAKYSFLLEAEKLETLHYLHLSFYKLYPLK